MEESSDARLTSRAANVRGRTSKFTRVGAGLVLTLLVGLPLSSQGDDDFQMGLKAYLDADYETALDYWRPMADEGHATAQYCMGNMYYSGKGVEKDRGQAAVWFRKSAEQGHPVAQLNLGNAYRWGEGVQQDVAQAAHWWRKAAEKNYAPAQFNLGALYQFGRGVTRDEGAAREWYRKAATNGYGPASRFLHKQGVQPRQPARVPSPPAKATPTVATTQPAPARASQPEQDNPSARHATAPTSTSSTGRLLDETWLLARDPGHYTIQLIAVRDRAGIEAYVRRHQLSGSVASFFSQRNGLPLYTLVYGDFEGLSPARHAVAVLPDSVRRNGTWVRPFSGVQQAISDARLASTY